MVTTTTGLATSFIQFSRPGASGGGATVTDRDGKIKWAGHNLLTNSESFDASAWTKETGVTVTANAVASPNGTTTADQVDMSSTGNGIYQAVSVLASTAYTAGVWVRGDASGTITIRPAFGGTSSSVSVTTEWQYVTIAVNTVNTTNGLYVQRGAGNLSRVYLWGAHLYRSDLGGMQANPAMPATMASYYPTTPKNLLGYTEDFSNAYWTKTAVAAFGSGSISNAIIAPNGLQTADLIVPSTTNTFHDVRSPASITLQQSTPYNVTTYVKAGGYNFFEVGLSSNSAFGSYGVVVFNLSSGTDAGTGSSVNYTVSNKSITSVGDGWYRVSFVVTPHLTTTTGMFFATSYPTSTRGVAFAGDGTSGIYIWGAQLSDSASLDTYVPVYGAAVTSAAYYAPRLDFDGATLAAKGLLVEEARTNLIVRSQEFNDAAWIKTSVTVTTDATTGPDGVASAALVMSDAGTTNQVIRTGSITIAASTTYNLSFFFKNNGSTAFWVRILNGGGTSTLASCVFNPSTNAISSSSGFGANPTFTNVGNGFYRFSGAFPSGAQTNAIVYLYPTNLLDTSQGAYLYGAQLEAGSFATSYIPTGASTATRAADVASVSTQAFPYSASEGTIVVSADTTSSNRATYSLDNGTADNRVYGTAGVSGGFNNAISSAGNNVFTQTLGAIVESTPFKAGIAYALDNVNSAVNGTAGTTDTSAALPSAATVLKLGSNSTPSVFLNGHIRQITYLPRRISNAELVTRTQ